jgi:regulator of protease activity HflC (stomatin/prohibitin superfamily)
VSDETPTNPNPESQPPEGESAGPGSPVPGGMPTASGRATSVRFRADADVRDQARAAMRMDAANESLADALRITFRLVQVGMFVLVLLFLGSGFRMIQEGERGLRVRLGKIQDSNLERGLAFAWPYPIGEIVPIGAGSLELRLETNREFFPMVSNGKWSQAESELSQRNSLDPAEDGSLITADLNIAHTQWTVNYRRDDHVEYATNVIPAQERELVRVAAMTGVVHAVAMTTIDELLKDRDTVAAEARHVAQAKLDEMQSGLKIENMTLNKKFGPATLLDDFAKVQSAQQEAGQKREEARTLAQDELNRVAGLGASHLVSLIDEYEASVEVGENLAESEAILAQIDAMLDGEPVQIDGQTVTTRVSGEVSQILANARNDAFQIVSDARGDLELFRAQLERYEANPRLMVMREWADGMRVFYNKPFVQLFMVRDGQSDAIQVRINEDPDIKRMLEEAQRLQQAGFSGEARDQEQRRALEDFDATQGN